MIDNDKYGIVNYYELDEEPNVIGYTSYRNNQYTKYKLVKIIGQVLEKDNVHHTVTVLTKFGVVNVKYNKGNYAFYNKVISFINEEGKKVVLEKSLFEKGTKVLILGFRRGGYFIAKKYNGCGFNNTTMRIKSINIEDGGFSIKEERTQL